MTLFEAAVLAAGLFVLSQVVAIPLGALVGKRVGVAHWVALVAAGVLVTYYGVLVLTGGS